ncbi:MAG: HPF/RaiA family ribosome-associated protein [Phycisphaerales bacterium]|nr:HPF/RaiA family ribosome-associated protein [Phycisphaerales bacterium]
MKLKVTSQNKAVSDDLVTLVHRQVGYALARFESRIRNISVRLSDLNGPKGGIDKHCKIMVTFRNGDSVVAEVADVEFEPVIHRAVDRVAKRVQRHWRTMQTRARSAATIRKNETGVGE